MRQQRKKEQKRNADRTPFFGLFVVIGIPYSVYFVIILDFGEVTRICVKNAKSTGKSKKKKRKRRKLSPMLMLNI